MIYKEINTNILGKGIIYITDDVVLTISYNKDSITKIITKINTPVINCINSTSKLDNISMALQTSLLVIDTIRNKIN